MQKVKKIDRAVSEKTTLPSNQPTNQPTNQPVNQPTNQPMLIWRPFCEYLQMKNFFEKPVSSTFLPL